MFLYFDLEMSFVPEWRAIFISDLATWLRSHKSLEKHSNSRLSYLFALLSPHSVSSLIFSLLLFSSVTLPICAFPSLHIVGSLTPKLPSIMLSLSIKFMGFVGPSKYKMHPVHPKNQVRRSDPILFQKPFGFARVFL